MAKGLAKVRKSGRRMPGHMIRDLRILDGAAHLLDHPNVAADLVESCKQWLRGHSGGSISPSSDTTDDGAPGDDEEEAKD